MLTLVSILWLAALSYTVWRRSVQIKKFERKLKSYVYETEKFRKTWEEKAQTLKAQQKQDDASDHHRRGATIRPWETSGRRKLIRVIVALSVLVLLYDRLEYTWYPFDGDKYYVTIPYVFDGEPIRLDSYIYDASVKLEHVVTILIIHLLLSVLEVPLRRETLLMLIAFGIALVEYFFTFNEPIAKIPLPIFYIPVSAATLKFASICYFMSGCVRFVFRNLKY